MCASLFMTAVLAAIAHAHTPGVLAPIRSTSSATVAADPVVLVRGSLREVSAAQERFHRRHGRYAEDLDGLREAVGLVIEPGVVVRLVEASEQGWAAEGTHSDVPERSCVLWSGRPGSVGPIETLHERKRGDLSPGRVVCDEAWG